MILQGPVALSAAWRGRHEARAQIIDGRNFRCVQRFTPLLVEAARPCRHSVGGRWFVDETYVKLPGSWRYVYRAVDQYGQVMDVFLSKKRDLRAAAFFGNAIRSQGEPAEVTTDRADALGRAIAELLPVVPHATRQYANKPGRSRPWTVKGQTSADAGPEASPHRQRDHRRPRVH